MNYRRITRMQILNSINKIAKDLFGDFLREFMLRLLKQFLIKLLTIKIFHHQNNFILFLKIII